MGFFNDKVGFLEDGGDLSSLVLAEGSTGAGDEEEIFRDGDGEPEIGGSLGKAEGSGVGGDDLAELAVMRPKRSGRIRRRGRP